MDMKDLLGGKGANLAEMTSVLELPVPPGLHHHHRRLPRLHGRRLARRARRRDRQARRAGSRRRWAAASATPPTRCSCRVRSGAKFSMPGMMDTVLNLGLNDRSVKGLAAATGDERFAYDSYRRFISMYGRIVLGIDGARLRRAVREGQGHGRRGQRRRGPRRRAAPSCATELQGGREGAHRQAVPAGARARSCAAPSRRCSARWNGARAIAYRVRERISHDLGTAVNVQAMVFGNRDDNSGTGVGFTRNAATGENRPYGDFLVNAQGEDVVAGIRNTEDLDALGAPLPGDPRRAARHLRPARGALPRHVRHRVHHRAGQALDAADPRRQAHRRRRAAHGRRHDQASAAGRSRRPRRCSGSPPTTSTRCCTRSSPAPT